MKPTTQKKKVPSKFRARAERAESVLGSALDRETVLVQGKLELELILPQINSTKASAAGLSGMRAIAQKGENRRRGVVGGGVGHHVDNCQR